MNLPNKKQGMLLIISGPSGVGKTTIARHVEHELEGVFSVSMTTRPTTAADTEGKDYYFVDQNRFEQAGREKELLESAKVFDHWYGTPRQPVTEALTAGHLMVLEIDVEGATQVKQNIPDAYAIFVLPPSEDELLLRLRGRKREDEKVIQYRFNNARKEIARAKAGGVYDLFLVNDDLPRAQQEIIDHVSQEWARRRG